MKNWKNLLILLLTFGSLTLTSCLHIIEEVTFRNDKSGSYKMTIDMSEVKGMMDALKDMGGDSTATDTEGEEPPAEAPQEDNSMAEMGQELSNVAKSLRGVAGITNVTELNDTSAFKFGYSFDFATVEALNRAMKIINKEKYDATADEVFKFNGKSFERLPVGDIGGELKKALTESEEESDEENMEMLKMFFADMTYQQVYTFPDKMIKKSTNTLSEVSPDGHSVTITLKPFNEEQQKSKASVTTQVKLK